jgi:ATP-binding cassette subfamily B (MDR/TAP) protein 1
MLCTALGLWYGGTLVIRGEYTLFQFILSHAAIIICGDAAGFIFSNAPDFAKARNSAARLKVLLDAHLQQQTSSGYCVETYPVLQDRIEFASVGFTYPTRPERPILNGLNLTIPQGKYVALVGPSGSGKSTIVALLERFYRPLTGSITTDGRSLSAMDMRAYRTQAALVNQEPALFQGTVRENLMLGLDATRYCQLDLEKACKDAHILDFVLSLP